MNIRRIVVGLDAFATEDEPLRLAAELARAFEAEIEGLFVEDLDLLRAASLPFAREVGSFSAAARPFERTALEGQLRAVARRARARLLRAFSGTEVRAGFRVVRGRVPGELVAALGGADLLVVGGGRPLRAGPAHGLGSAARALARSGGRLLIVPRRPGRRRSPAGDRPAGRGAARESLAVVHDASASGGDALRIAALLARRQGRDLLAYAVADDEATRADLAREAQAGAGPDVRVRAEALARAQAGEAARRARERGARLLIAGMEPAEPDAERLVAAFGGPVLQVRSEALD